MNIWILTQYYPPEFGAVAVRLGRLAQMLAAEGHKVTVLTSMPNYPSGIIPPEYRRRVFWKETSGCVDIHRVWVYASPSKGILARLLNQVSFMLMAALRGTFLRRPDLLYVESHPLFVCLAGGWLRRVKKAPVVLNVSDLWPQSAVAVGVLRADSLMVKGAAHVERWAYYTAAHLVGMTSGVCRGILAVRPEPDRVSLIRNAVDLGQLRPGQDAKRAQMRRRLNLEGKLVAAQIGNMGLVFDFDILLDVASALSEIEFIMVGDGARSKYIERQRQVRALTNMKMFSAMPYADMPALWAATDICVFALRDHPLFEGTLPVKMFEAMATGTPIVAAIRGESEIMLRDTGAGIPVPPNDRAAMIESLRILVESPERRKQMGAAGRAYAEEHLSPERVKEAFVDVFKRVTHDERTM